MILIIILGMYLIYFLLLVYSITKAGEMESDDLYF